MLEMIGYASIGLMVGFLLAWMIQHIRFSRRIENLRIDNIGLQKEREADVQRIKWMEITEEKMKETFKALSADLLTSNAH